MKFRAVHDPLEGERTVDVVPTPAPLVDAPWSRQRFVTGRAVSAEALRGEQDHHSGHLRIAGQALRPGVVTGLEPGVEDDGTIVVSAGTGVCASGETLVLPRALRLVPGTLDVRATVGLPESVPGADETTPRDLARVIRERRGRVVPPFIRPTPSGIPSISDVVAPVLDSVSPGRGASARATDLLGDNTGIIGPRPRRRLPLLAVLVIEPVVIEELGNAGDPTTDPCDRDPGSEPFEDWRYVDAVRALWVPLAAWLDEDGIVASTWESALPTQPHALRNAVAATLFAAEAAREEGDAFPWARDGVAIALAAFDDHANLLWLDRWAVARHGGRRLHEDTLVPGAGTPALWRARLDQFADHLLELDLTVPLASQIRFVPPVGLLPRGLFDLEDRTNTALPGGWGLSAVPVPLDQLDAAIRPALGLGIVDLAADGDELKLLLPVPAASWDPGLLRVASVPAEFTRALDEAVGLRDDALLRRAEVRARLSALYGGLAGPTAVPVFAIDTTGDTQVEDQAYTWYWHNADWMALVDQLGTDSSPPLLPGTSDVTAAVNAAVIDPAVRPVLATALGQIAATDPVIALRADPSASPSGTTGSAVVIAAGMILPEMTRDAVARASFLTAPLLYLVNGAVDTEAIDRAVARAAGRPLLLVGDSWSDAGKEELAWRLARHPESIVVAVTLPRRFAAAADLHADLRARLSLSSARSTEWFGGMERAYITSTRCVIGCPSPSAAALTTYAASHFDTPLAALPEGDPLRDPLLERKAAFGQTQRAAWIQVPDRQGLTAAVQGAADRVQALRAVDDETTPDEAELLRRTGAREDTFGTSPTSEGLFASALEELVDTLQQKVTPETALRVVRDDELATIGSFGVVGLIALLEEKVKRADDAVDFGFLQVQAQVYRLRELMLGRATATKMASSPILADISKLIQGDSSPEQLAAFFDALKAAAAAPPPPTPAPSWRDTIYKSANVYVQLRPELTTTLVDSLTSAGRLLASTSFIAEDPVPAESGASLKTTISRESAKSTTDRMRTDLLAKSTTKTTTKTTTTVGRTAAVTSFAATSGGSAEARASGTPAPPPPPPAPPQTRIVESGGPSPADLGTTSRTVAQVVNAEIERRKILQPPFTIRTAGLAQRVEKDDQATELRQAAFRLRAALTQTVFRLELNLQGVPFPGFLTGSPPVQTALPLTATLVAEVLAGKHDVDSDQGTAPALFSDTVESLETTAAVLRVVEARIREVREAIEAAKRTKLSIERSIGEAEAREVQVGELLEQARADLGATRALLHEETERVAALNAERARVRAEEIPFVALRRAREVELRDTVPVHDVEPTWSTKAVLALFDRPAPPAPEELREAIELLDDVPVRWFPPLAALLPKLDTVAQVHDSIRASVARAATPRQVTAVRAGAWHTVYRARQESLAQRRQASTAIDVRAIPRLTWKQGQAQAHAILTVGDLTSAAGRRPAITRAASRFLDHVYTLAANLYTEVGLIAPHIRAEWVKLLSDADVARDLRDLSDLPRWAEVGQAGVGQAADPFRRRELQGMVDWLFQQVDTKEPEAVELANDLVRISILLASHAPVGRLLAGLVDEDASAEPGRLVGVRVDVTQARVGMTALFVQDGVVRARALVEDVGADRVHVRFVSGAAGTRVSAGHMVHLVESDGVVHPGAESAAGGGVRMTSTLTYTSGRSGGVSGSGR